MDGIEVRREYIKDFPTELVKINSQRNNMNLLVNYSVPDELFLKDGSINPKLSEYFEEGQKMGVEKIKFNIGNFENFDGDLKKAFENYPLKDIQLNVENDQTSESGNIDNILNFLKEVKKANLNIGYVYDLGNWAFTQQNADVAAEKLGRYVDYIHLKNSKLTTNGWVTTEDLNDGMFDVKYILNELPKDADIALEFPMKNDNQIERQVRLLKDEVKK